MNASHDPQRAPVSEQDVQQFLDTLTRHSDPVAGLFGPDSMFWEINRHSLVYFLGAVQSVQMQLCHPWVATAVYEHSKIMSDPRQRARLTYTFLWTLIYGDMDSVRKRAMGLYRVHGRVTGTLEDGSPYQANEANALLWVHVTAFYCRVKLYEQLVRPLSESDKDRFVQEARRYAHCFAIPDALHPQSWQETERYVHAVINSGVLKRSAAGLEIRHFLENSLPSTLRKPLWRFLCNKLPAPLAVMLDQPIDHSPIMDRVFRMLSHTLPASLRYVPAWHEAMARINGSGKFSRVAMHLNKALLGKPRLVS